MPPGSSSKGLRAPSGGPAREAGPAPLCIEGTCVSGSGGNGSSCASPQFLAPEAEDTGFRATSSAAARHVFPCGPLEAIPTKWFRFTGSKSDTNVELEVDGPNESLILAVYSSASCDDAALIGCIADEDDLTIEVANANTKTFFVAVGNTAPGSVAASIRIDR